MLFLLFLLLMVSNPSWADPGWLHPDITKEECQQEFWKTRGMCYQVFYKQQTRKYEDFVLFELGSLDDGSCKGVTEVYLEREAAWAKYKSAACALQMHCRGPCGSGESSGWHDCHAGIESQKYERLQDTVKNGIEIWGCRFRPNERTRRFETRQFDIVIEAGCPTGRFDCDRIKYTGVNKKTGESIELIGKELMVIESEDVPHNRFKGYVFENGDITYKLLASGRLIVQNQKRSETLLDEEGTWSRR